MTTRINGITFLNNIPSKFLTICDNLLEGLQRQKPITVVKSNDYEPKETAHKSFERLFTDSLEEGCRSTYRRDGLGNMIEIPYLGRYKQMKSGQGIGIPKDHQYKEDKHHKGFAIPPGYILKLDKQGHGKVVCSSTQTAAV